MYKIAKLNVDDRRALFRNTAAKMHLNEAIVLFQGVGMQGQRAMGLFIMISLFLLLLILIFSIKKKSRFASAVTGP